MPDSSVGRGARIAVLADSAQRRLLLHRLLRENGWQVALSTAPAQLTPAVLGSAAADLWLIALEHEEAPPLLDESPVPLLFCEGLVPERGDAAYLPFERRLLGKLQALLQSRTTLPHPPRAAVQHAPSGTAVSASPQATPADSAANVWLLCASMGGPRAVKRFLDALPAALPLALLYAQHIDAQFENLLPAVVGRHSRFRVSLSRHGQTLAAGQVSVVPVTRELSFSAEGRLRIAQSPWPGRWQPSFNHMMLSLARYFGSRAGVIVFSGMDNDCTAAAAEVRRRGVPIWTQNAGSCACPNMPAALESGGYSQKSGEPEELALALAAHLQSPARLSLECP